VLFWIDSGCKGCYRSERIEDEFRGFYGGFERQRQKGGDSKSIRADGSTISPQVLGQGKGNG